MNSDNPIRIPFLTFTEMSTTEGRLGFIKSCCWSCFLGIGAGKNYAFLFVYLAMEEVLIGNLFGILFHAKPYFCKC